MKVAATIQGTERLAAALERLDAVAVAMMNVGLRQAAIAIHGEAVKSIQEHRSEGRRYGRHIASAAGFPPNTDSGRLVKSIELAVDEGSFTAVVGTDIEYGGSLEFGTARIRARPWLGPAYRKVRPSIVGYFKLRVAGGR